MAIHSGQVSHFNINRIEPIYHVGVFSGDFCSRRLWSNSLADFRSGRIAEKQALGFRGGAGQEFAKQVGDEALLEIGGLGQAVEDADVPGTLLTAGAHADFAEDDQRTKRPFGMVVGGGTIKTDEFEYFGVLAGAGDEALSQGFGLSDLVSLHGFPIADRLEEW
jgi:hypothetical protein